VPWKKRSKVKHDLAAPRVLDADHYGLEKVKERILEYLAVQKRVKQGEGPILCLVGPPGVGKTSLGESIARATNRKFVRMALGGVRDEAEIRGHRRTYIGSMPGKLLQKMAKAGVRNPLFPARRDRQDGHGSPRRSGVGAARGARPGAEPRVQRSLPGGRLRPLRRHVRVYVQHHEHPGAAAGPDGVIRIPGYTEDEKLNIAQRYLIPKQIKLNGLKEDELTLSETRSRHHPLLHARSRRARP
jgi:ATP-dependent Lon protease